jgi:hypothetical protein
MGTVGSELRDVGERGGPAALVVEFAGERVEVAPCAAFAIGRRGDLVIDDNPYLHREFLELSVEDGMWWLGNVGSRLSAVVTDGTGGVRARLAPGARLPIAYDVLHVLFDAGPTRYDLTVHSTAGASRQPPRPAVAAVVDEDTLGAVPLTFAQRLLVVALAENVLRQTERGDGEIPSSAEAAARLGWTLTAFTRKLDTVCAKLGSQGVSGLRGEGGRLATHRRQRLVEHAVATRLVTRDDLALLDGAGAPSDD